MKTSLLVVIGCTYVLYPSIASAQSHDAVANDIVLELPPTPENPRNGEGDFITLKDGRILFVYTRFTGAVASDHAPAQLVSRYSNDEGQSWSSQDRLEVDKEGEMNVMSVSLLRMQNGTIALFYMRKNSMDDCLLYLRTSNDEAGTWSEPRLIINDRSGYFVTNNDRVIKLKNGRILVPVSRHKTKDMDWSNKGEMRCYFSDDNGGNWFASTMVPTPDSIITQEPGLIELEDGRIFMIIRASGGFQYHSYSNDRGLTWSLAKPTEIKSPISPASIERIRPSGKLLLVWNNNGASGPGYFKAKRTPLSLAYSSDDGQSWNFIEDIEPDPNGFYCYTAIHQVDDAILLSYVRKMIGDEGLGACVRRINISEISP